MANKEYFIEIIHKLTGNVEIIKAKQCDSYKKTLKKYKEVKQNYKGKNVDISFIGVVDGETKVYFTKRSNPNEDILEKINTLIDTMHECSKELRNTLQQISDKTALLDKQKSNVQHLLIESVDAYTISDSDKVKAFDEYRTYTLERRDMKQLNYLYKALSKQVGELSNKIHNVRQSYDSQIDFNVKITQDLIENEESEYRDVHLIREYSYDNFKQRINLMKQLDKKFDKIVNDVDNNKLLCYNKCRG